MGKYIKNIVALLVMTLIFSMVGNTIVRAEDADESDNARTIYVTNYKSFLKAINSVQEDDKIILKNNISTSKQTTLKKDVSYTIDFNGKMYKYTGKKQAFIISKGNVSFKNPVMKSKNYIIQVNTNGNLYIVNGTYSGYILNKGTLEIKKGTFNNTGAKTSKKDELIQNKGDLIIEGGKFTNSYDNVIYNTTGYVEIYGGTFVGKSKVKETEYPTVLNCKNGTMHIYNAVVKGIGGAILNQGELYIDNGKFTSSQWNTVINTGEMTINNGILKGNDKKYALVNYKKLVVNYADIPHMLISGGTAKIYDGDFGGTNHEALYIEEGKVTIYDGEFLSKKSNTIVVDTKATLNLKGGAIRSKSLCAAISSYGTLNLYDGEVYCKKGYYPIYIASGKCYIKDNVSYFKTTMRKGSWR